MKAIAPLTLGIAAALGAVLPAQNERELAELRRQLDAQNARIQQLEANAAATPALDQASGFEAAYDGGFVIRSTDGASVPFELKINGRLQARYTGFSPDVDTFSNLESAAAGMPIPVTSRNEFELERARLEFTGTWVDPRLHFYLNLDADTDDSHQVIFHDFWFNYEFHQAFDLYAGKAFVPGSRDWLSGSTRTHFADRSMATTFFRPDRSVGVWVIGEPIENVHYRVMLANGIASTDLTSSQVDDRFAYSGSFWWDPLGNFGKGYADLEQRADPVARVGTSFTVAQEEAGFTFSGIEAQEARIVRLSDGSRLTALGVNTFDHYLAAVDAAFKWCGLGVHGEAFYRWLREISPTGAPPAGFPLSEQDDWGFYVDGGLFVVPSTLEPVVRVSSVQGDIRDSWEYAAGLNYYVDHTHKNKLTLDATWLDGAPTRNSGPNYRVGDDGVMVRLQWQIAF